MPSNHDNHRDTVDRLYSEFEADGGDFEDFVSRHPDHADVLRTLHALLQKRAGESGVGEAAEQLDTSSLAQAVGFDTVLYTDPPASEAPKSVGAYRLLEPLGEGGMGTVYLAEQTRPIRRRVALKLIKRGMDTKEVVARFEAERQALALMDHASIARVYEAGVSEVGQPYFVMEHVEGGPIHEYCDRRCFSTRERLELFVEICDAVHHAHQRGIIHRDLKPSNILVTDDGEKRTPKIIDFGIAKAISQRLTERTLFTERGQLVGTPEYMSPEQACPGVEDVDTRTDVYALGIVLYQLLTGALPFSSESLRSHGFEEMLHVIREVDPPTPSRRIQATSGAESERFEARRKTSLRALEKQLRGDLDWITMKALDKDRVRRYDSAAAFGADIRRYLADEPVLASPPSAAYRLRKLLKRNRERVVLGALVVLALATLLGYRLVAGQLEYRRQIELSESHLEEGKRSLDSYLELGDQLSRLKAEGEAEGGELWKPIWERRDALERTRETEEKDLERRVFFESALSELTLALSSAPEGSRIRASALDAIAAAYSDTMDEARERGSIRLDERFFESMAETARRAGGAPAAATTARVRIESEPSGAEVWAFRYSRFEERLVPVPLSTPPDNPKAGLELEVERVWIEGLPFLPGDQILVVRGGEIRTLEDLALALSDLPAGTEVVCRVLRGSREREIHWVPFRDDPIPLRRAQYSGLRDTERELRAGYLVDSRAQLGLTFSAYPLSLSEASRVGVTSSATALELSLGQGSYLLVFRREGYSEVRFPFVVPGESEIRPRLVRTEDTPEGFVVVPGGVVPLGGDVEAFQSLSGRLVDVPRVFMQRHEVTNSQYLAFLRSMNTAPDTAESFETRLIKWNESTGWTLDEQYNGAPVFGIRHRAAEEYARWKTRTGGGRWKYRLPRDVEWEKAARGADRRGFVFGDVFVPTFCWAMEGIAPDLSWVPRDVGAIPYDESPYGIRDLAGSVSEWTAGQPVVRHPEFRSRRGGHFKTFDTYEFRCASRNTVRDNLTREFVGFRLVAELADDE